jgi:hypothetical protein
VNQQEKPVHGFEGVLGSATVAINFSVSSLFQLQSVIRGGTAANPRGKPVAVRLVLAGLKKSESGACQGEGTPCQI